ncbi:MAG: M56 family metallopeptidase [Chitinophagales bacterium]|nr:M56 family metallopeptidase [Chitinophagales bacterium]
MQSFVHSILLQSLGYAILQSLWQMALLWLLYSFIAYLFKLRSKTKYTVAACVQITGFVWFLLTIYYYIQLQNDSTHLNELNTLNDNFTFVSYETNNFNGIILNSIVRVEKILPYLSFAYLLILSFLFFKWSKSYSTTQMLRNKGLQKIDVQWKLFIKETAAHLGIKKEIKIYISNLITSPLTIGFFKPIILVPLASINLLSTQQMEAVLLHELAHIKRLDYLLNLLLSFIEVILFFNPFTKLISIQIQNERENACDDWVLQFKYNSTLYAEALLKLAVLHNNISSLSLYATPKKNNVVSRVRRMTNNNYAPIFNYKKNLLILLFLSFSFASIVYFLNYKNGKTKTIVDKEISNENKNNIQVYLQPISLNADNPIFNPLSLFKKPLQAEISKSIANAEKKVNISVNKTSNAIATINEVNNENNSNITTEKSFTIDSLNLKLLTNNAISIEGNFINIPQKAIELFSEKFNNVAKAFNTPVFSNANSIKLKHNNVKLNQILGQKISLIKAKGDSVLTQEKINENSYLAKVDSLQENYFDNYTTSTSPFKYALNYLTDTSYAVTTNYPVDDENVTYLFIKKKRKENEKIPTEPKYYEIVISKVGEPDKILIIEIW